MKKKAIRYIANQEEHHWKESFQEEYRRMLNLHEIDWEEACVWG